MLISENCPHTLTPYMNSFERISELAAQSMQTLDRSRFPIFVFGPYLPENEVVAKPSKRAKDHSKYLRYSAKEQLKESGFKVQFGESNDVINVWQQHIRSQDLASSELHHAHYICGAVIIFASSVGSFCELGLFASYESIISKTIVIVDSKYKDHRSFLNDGLLKIVEQENGRVIFEDYRDHAKCVRIATQYAEGKFTKIQRDFLQLEQSRAKEKRLGPFLVQK